MRYFHPAILDFLEGTPWKKEYFGYFPNSKMSIFFSGPNFSKSSVLVSMWSNFLDRKLVVCELGFRIPNKPNQSPRKHWAEEGNVGRLESTSFSWLSLVGFCCDTTEWSREGWG